MRRNQLTFKDLSEEMGIIGTVKHEVTLRTWFDEGSHIVGPRDVASFHTIAKITKDSQMSSDPGAYFQACREVRSMRIRILRYIGRNIIQTYNKDNDLKDEVLSNLSIDISKMSRLVQIEKIVNTGNLVIPSHLANRPQTI